MVAIVERLCVKDWEITAQNGDHFEIRWGQVYTTSKDPNEHGQIVVFSDYWVPVPPECFAAQVRER